MEQELDLETQKTRLEGDQVLTMVRSDGWKIARENLIGKISDLNSITGLGDSFSEKEIGARQLAVQILMDFLADIEGRAKQHKEHETVLREFDKSASITVIEEFGE